MVVGEIAMGTQLLVIGGGPGGYVAALRAAQLGVETTLVEREEVGGICLNHGCIPSKALIHGATLAHKIPQLAELGIETKGLRVDAKKLQAWKQKVVKKLTSGVEQLLRANGVQILKGTAVFQSPQKVLVESEHGTQAVEFKHCILATGSRSIELPGFEFDGEVVLGSRHALQLAEIPEKLVVIGGGYIGLELGTVFAELGSKVTVVELMDQLLPGTDPELVRVVERRLKALGVEVYTQSKATGLKRGRSGAKLTVETPKGEISLEADKVLVSVGRKPNTQGLSLERAKIERDERGFVKIDGQLRTTNPRVWAIGDVAGPPMLAHKASHEGLVAAEIIAGKPAGPDWQAVPAVIFTDPEIAYVGLTEREAKEQGYEVITGKFPFTALGRALTMGETDGFVKVVADAQTHVVLGVQIVGPEASTLIGEATLAVEMGARLEDLALTVHAHPTLPEALMEAAEVALGQPIHVLLPKRTKTKERGSEGS